MRRKRSRWGSLVEAGTESHAGQQKITSNIRHVCDPKPGVPPSARRPSRACRPVRRLASRCQNRVPAKRTQKLIADESPSSRARDVAATSSMEGHQVSQAADIGRDAAAAHRAVQQLGQMGSLIPLGSHFAVVPSLQRAEFTQGTQKGKSASSTS